MRCQSCEHKNLPEARFCGHCGSALSPRACPTCGWSLQSDDAFCPGCGIAVQATTLSVTEPITRTARGAQPINYTPKHLAQQILTARATIEGELKQATVLFADIVDSTRLTYGKDPEAADMVLGPAIEVMRKAVFRYEGYVRPRGDGIQALFGVPLSHEDHAVRGCVAALEIIAGVAELAADHGAGEPIQVRIGLHSGEIIVKRIHDDLLLELDAIGATVALASRMEGLAAPGTVQITASTFALAERSIRAERRGKIAVRGVAEPVEVFQLKAMRRVPSRFHRVTDGGVANFVGRELEMEILAYAWQEASRGHGQVVAFVGEPGVGKSRLFSEFMHSSATQGALVLEASSVSYGRATPFLPIIALLREYFNIHATDDEAQAKEKINDKLMALDPVLMTHRAAICFLLNFATDDMTWSTYDPIQRRHNVLKAVTEIILRQARSQPICLTFEDLHWIDSETEALLDQLVEFIPIHRIILLVNYRPEYPVRWSRKTYFRQLPIGPLPDETARQLLDDLIGRRAELGSLKTRLIEQTAGNPLFLEESVQMLKELAVLSGGRGNGQLAQAIGDTHFLPASVQSTIKARIDRLGPDEKHVLDFASVFGKDFTYSALKASIDVEEDTLQVCLRQLQSLEFIYQTSQFPEPEYTFKHALTYQVAYHSLLNERRRAMHSVIVRTIEQRSGQRTTDHVEDLARHAYQGEMWDKATRYSFAAGKKAFERSAHTESVQHLEKALMALRRIAIDDESRTLDLDIRFLLRYALLNLGEVTRVGELLDDTLPLITALDKPQKTGQFEAFLSNYCCLTGDQYKAVEHASRALTIAQSNNDRVLQVEMAYRIAQPYYHLAKYQDAIKVLEEAVERIGPDDALHRLGMSAMPMVVCRTWLTLCHAELGEFTQADRHASAAVDLVIETQHPLSTAFAFWGLGHLCLNRRDYARAQWTFEKGLDVCKRWSLRVWHSRLSSSLGVARALSGQAEEAVVLIEEALREAQAMHFEIDMPRLFERLATAQLLSGHKAIAESAARQAISLAIKRDAKGHQAWAQRMLGEVLSADEGPNWQEANDSFNTALGLAGALGMRPLSALCHEGIARMHEKLGRPEDAHAAHGKAAAIRAEAKSRS